MSASIDAALALVEKMLPECTAWELRSMTNRKRFSCALSWLVDDEEEAYFGRSATPALAILTALSTALQGKDKQ